MKIFKVINNFLSLFTMLNLVFAFQNCSKTQFGELSSQSSQSPNLSSSVTIEEEPTQVDVESTPELPKLSTTIPDCLPNTTCRIQFKLSKPNTLAVQFHWRTDDYPLSQWKTGVLPANVIWGVAAVHYVSDEGVITFDPGQTTKAIEFRNINQSASGIRIKVLLNNCVLGVASYRCQLFF
jgi:hypothetical protein